MTSTLSPDRASLPSPSSSSSFVPTGEATLVEEKAEVEEELIRIHTPSSVSGSEDGQQGSARRRRWADDPLFEESPWSPSVEPLSSMSSSVLKATPRVETETVQDTKPQRRRAPAKGAAAKQDRSVKPFRRSQSSFGGGEAPFASLSSSGKGGEGTWSHDAYFQLLQQEEQEAEARLLQTLPKFHSHKRLPRLNAQRHPPNGGPVAAGVGSAGVIGASKRGPASRPPRDRPLSSRCVAVPPSPLTRAPSSTLSLSEVESTQAAPSHLQMPSSHQKVKEKVKGSEEEWVALERKLPPQQRRQRQKPTFCWDSIKTLIRSSSAPQKEDAEDRSLLHRTPLAECEEPLPPQQRERSSRAAAAAVMVPFLSKQEEAALPPAALKLKEDQEASLLDDPHPNKSDGEVVTKMRSVSLVASDDPSQQEQSSENGRLSPRTSLSPPTCLPSSSSNASFILSKDSTSLSPTADSFEPFLPQRQQKPSAYKDGPSSFGYPSHSRGLLPKSQNSHRPFLPQRRPPGSRPYRFQHHPHPQPSEEEMQSYCMNSAMPASFPSYNLVPAVVIGSVNRPDLSTMGTYYVTPDGLLISPIVSVPSKHPPSLPVLYSEPQQQQQQQQVTAPIDALGLGLNKLQPPSGQGGTYEEHNNDDNKDVNDVNEDEDEDEYEEDSESDADTIVIVDKEDEDQYEERSSSLARADLRSEQGNTFSTPPTPLTTRFQIPQGKKIIPIIKPVDA